MTHQNETDPVVVFIVSKNSPTTHRRVLWRMSRTDAMKVCSDPRTGITAHPRHMLCWTDKDIDDPDLNRYIPDNGYYDDVLRDHQVTIYRRNRAEAA